MKTSRIAMALWALTPVMALGQNPFQDGNESSGIQTRRGGNILHTDWVCRVVRRLSASDQCGQQLQFCSPHGQTSRLLRR